MRIHHHSYLVQGVTDEAVMRLQAERRRDTEDEVTVVHAHEHGVVVEIACNERCMLFEPGYKTRSVLSDTKEPEEDE